MKIKATSGLQGVKNVRYVYEYQGGAVQDSEITRDSVHTFLKPGLYRVLQYSEQENRQLRACAIVQVYDTLQPELTISACQTRIIVSIPKAIEYQYDWYTVDWGDGSREQLGGATPVGVHTYSDEQARTIRVRGVHLYGDCGGTSQLVFRPDTKATLPVIEHVQAVGARALELRIRNPDGNRYWIEQRIPGGDYVRKTAHSEAALTTQMDADTTVSTCFRVVLADTCLSAPPAAEVCYVPPKPPDPLPIPDSTVFMPDAFSPNADGINDRFFPQGLLGGTLRLTVYNRWGEVVFRSDNAADGWDGYQRDQPLPAGAYAYRLEMVKPDGKRQEKRGTVLLLK
ncbi:gliding motility-associated C-terminal domain-containing protein [Larkinella ripae]